MSSEPVTVWTPPGYRGLSWTVWGCIAILALMPVMFILPDLGLLSYVPEPLIVGGAAALEARESGRAMSGVRAGVIIVLVEGTVGWVVGFIGLSVIGGMPRMPYSIGPVSFVIAALILGVMLSVIGSVFGGIGGLIGRRFGPTQPQHTGYLPLPKDSATYWSRVAKDGPVVREHDED